MPQAKGSNFRSPEAQSIVTQFCNESVKEDLAIVIISRRFHVLFCRRFFRIYDSTDRQTLAAAYHDDAVFTYSYHFNGLLERTK